MFDRDSKYYIEGESVCVAEFIDGTFAEDEYEFENLSYRKVYNEYFKLYDEGLAQEKIQTRLMNSMDEEIAAVAKDLLIEKYQITVENYEKSLTANSTRLVMFVPKALMAYQIKKLDKMISELMNNLNSGEDLEHQLETLAEISDLTRTRTRLNNELGRV
jgi:DNA primase